MKLSRADRQNNASTLGSSGYGGTFLALVLIAAAAVTLCWCILTPVY